MKKITLLAVLLMSAVTLQAQTSLTGSESGTLITNGDAGSATIAVTNRAPQTITNNNTQNTDPTLAIACASATAFRNNKISTVFDLVNDFGITTEFYITDAEIAIGPVTTPAGFPLTLNLYLNSGAAYPNGTLTLIGTTEVTITNADANTIISTPISATIPAGTTELVYEAQLIDDGTETNFMRFGANNDGPSGINWIEATNCGAATPTNFTALGLTQSIVMNLVGDTELSVDKNLLSQVSIYPNPASDILMVKLPSTVEVNNAVLYDVLGKNTGVTLVNGELNVSSLSRGVYILTLNTTAGTLTQKVVKQ